MEILISIKGICTSIAMYLLTYWFCAFVHEIAHIIVGKFHSVRAVSMKPALFYWQTSFIVDKNWERMAANPKAMFAMASAGWFSHLGMLLISIFAIFYYGPDILDGFVQRLAWVNGFLVIWLAIPTGHPDIDSDMSYAALREIRKHRKTAV